MDTKANLLSDIANGVSCLHSLSVVHADLKPSNVLLFPPRNGHTTHIAKLADFGFSQTDIGDIDISGSTPLWTAPECLPEAPESMRSYLKSMPRDAYSFGLIIWFVLFETEPFTDYNGLMASTDIATLKLKDDMKEEIEAEFQNHYQVRRPDGNMFDLFGLSNSWESSEVAERNSDAKASGSPYQDYMTRLMLARLYHRDPGGTWVASDDYRPVLLLAALEWLLVSDPRVRGILLEYFPKMLQSESVNNPPYPPHCSNILVLQEPPFYCTSYVLHSIQLEYLMEAFLQSKGQNRAWQLLSILSRQRRKSQKRFEQRIF